MPMSTWNQSQEAEPVDDCDMADIADEVDIPEEEDFSEMIKVAGMGAGDGNASD